MYKLILNMINNKVDVAMIGNTSFCFDANNTDYQAFKLALKTGTNADGSPVQLQDANGNIMTSDQIATFVATLP